MDAFRDFFREMALHNSGGADRGGHNCGGKIDLLSNDLQISARANRNFVFGGPLLVAAFRGQHRGCGGSCFKFDAREWDSKFPKHPISRFRRHLAVIGSTVRFKGDTY